MHKAWRLVQGPAQQHLGLHQITPTGPQQAVIAQDIDVGRVVLQGFEHVGLGLVALAQAHQSGTQRLVAHIAGRELLDQLSPQRQHFSEFSLFIEAGDFVLELVRGLARTADGSLLFDGMGHQALDQLTSGIARQAGPTGVFKHIGGQGVLIGQHQCIHQTDPIVVAPGVGLQCFLEERDSVQGTALLYQNGAQVVVGIGMIGQQTQGHLVQHGGLLPVFGAMALQRQLHGLVQKLCRLHGELLFR